MTVVKVFVRGFAHAHGRARDDRAAPVADGPENRSRVHLGVGRSCAERHQDENERNSEAAAYVPRWSPKQPSFKRRRADLLERRVSTPLVIEHLDVVEQLPRRAPISITPGIRALVDAAVSH
jgi:hypothetical protein